ncbi:hypothetical protein GIB67_023440 [Kingdonia uniflora]|uniref:Uncharacterized protein n=1 Tax=Kingdonia uniflora TaxID=39325 RepID=A0A7J7P9R7_9MAGN|nr:hypothetical protein GIB67_023440 [Kingdonia uniflora]
MLNSLEFWPLSPSRSSDLIFRSNDQCLTQNFGQDTNFVRTTSYFVRTKSGKSVCFFMVFEPLDCLKI